MSTKSSGHIFMYMAQYIYMKMKGFTMIAAGVGAFAIAAIAIFTGLVLKDSRAAGEFDSEVWNGSDMQWWAYFFDIEGTKDKPFIIDSGEKLATLAYVVNVDGLDTRGKYFVQTKNIIMNANYENYQSWGTSAPANIWQNGIGISSNPFRGIYDGGGFEIRGLYINTTIGARGLFGNAHGNNDSNNVATIKNLGITHSYIKGSTAGAIVAFSDQDLNIVNCYNKGTVIGTIRAGGIIASSAYGANITDCYNMGSVSVTNSGGYAGGIAGWAYSIGISNCYNAADISTAGYGAGIAGDGEYSQIRNCFNIATISGEIAAGIVGYGDAYVRNCYNKGSIMASICAGAISGEVYGYSGVVANCYNVGSVVGGLVSGMVGTASNQPIRINNCYWLDATVAELVNDYEDSYYSEIYDNSIFDGYGQLNISAFGTYSDLLQALNAWISSPTGGQSLTVYKTWQGTSADPFPHFDFGPDSDGDGEEEPEPDDDCLCPCAACVRERNL